MSTWGWVNEVTCIWVRETLRLAAASFWWLTVLIAKVNSQGHAPGNIRYQRLHRCQKVLNGFTRRQGYWHWIIEPGGKGKWRVGLTGSSGRSRLKKKKKKGVAPFQDILKIKVWVLPKILKILKIKFGPKREERPPPPPAPPSKSATG